MKPFKLNFINYVNQAPVGTFYASQVPEREGFVVWDSTEYRVMFTKWQFDEATSNHIPVDVYVTRSR